MELRCPSRIHGIMVDGRLEVKCHSRHCGKEPGVAVFHYFDPYNGKLLETRRYRDPAKLKKKERV